MQQAAPATGYIFRSVGHVEAGAGCLRRLGALTARFAGAPGRAPVLLVTDPAVCAGGLLEPALQSLQDAGFAIRVFDQICADAPDHLVLRACRRARDDGVAAVVGLGGSACLDAAKITACMAHPRQSLQLSQLYGVDSLEPRRLPLLQVPTTAGSGSEVSRVAVLTTGETTRSGIVNRALLADAALLDPQLTVSQPADATAANGMDAMAHAVEAFTSAHAKNPMSDMLAREALGLLGSSLLRAVQRGDDLGARERMLRGAMLAGMAFDNAPLAAVHALGYPLGLRHRLAHGLSNALVLPHVLRFNLPAAAPRYAELAQVLLPQAGGDTPSRAHALIDHLAALCRRSGLPTRLRDCGIAQSGLALLAREAMAQQRLLRNNPCTLTEADALGVYRAAF